jgi:serpin B
MKDQDFQAVALPYVGENVEMVVILPEQDRFKTVEAALDGQGFQAVLKNMKSRLGKGSLPKFGMEYKTSVGALLRALGMELAFTERADFSGMAKDGGLFISDVIHQTFLNVDEDGTEAAGATAVMMVGSSVPQDPPFDMVVDRPFIFAIVDRPTGTVLFLGRVTSL